MRGTRPTILFFSPAGRSVPDFLTRWVNGKGLTIVPVPDAADVEQRVLRSLPQLVVIDADGGPQGLGLCTRLKADSYSAIVPLAVLTSRHTTDRVQEWFTAGADEVISPLFEPTEQASRLDGLMTRTARDVAVNPSTRLPGTTEIERDIRRRMENGELFAVCYADLDHFKEYNDRYSYNDGDRVIYILSRILHDVVKGLLGGRGFIGHIGGDDFIFNIPFDAIPDVCGEVLDVFDTLIPFQYNEQDRRAGYYFGKDRRGQLHRVPLMTLSIGIVTNQHRRFAHPAQVSELATEMKSYAKTQPGSVFVVDRRHDPELDEDGGGTLDERHLPVVRDGVPRGSVQGPDRRGARPLRGVQQRVSGECRLCSGAAGARRGSGAPAPRRSSPASTRCSGGPRFRSPTPGASRSARAPRSSACAAAVARHAPLLGPHCRADLRASAARRAAAPGTSSCAARRSRSRASPFGAGHAAGRAAGGTGSAGCPATGAARSRGAGCAFRSGCPGGRGARAAHDEPAPPRESVHGPGSEAEGAPAGAGARVGSRRVPSREAPAGTARRHAAAALQGRDREELAGVRGAGGRRARPVHAVLGRGAERDSRRGKQGVLGWCAEV